MSKGLTSKPNPSGTKSWAFFSRPRFCRTVMRCFASANVVTRSPPGMIAPSAVPAMANRSSSIFQQATKSASNCPASAVAIEYMPLTAPNFLATKPA
ncbi:hypothetical protein D3C85_1076260 [compost metagenome]